MHTIKQRLRNLNRLRRIIDVLITYGFGYIVDRLNIERVVGRTFLRLRSVRRLRIFDLPVEVRLRKVLEELGPTFIKFGQILSTRPDLIPAPLCRELEKLQDEVPPFSYEQVRKQIEHAFHKPVDELFVEFTREPTAAASLAQVHRARLADGTVVLVKVQRPHIEETVKADIEILRELAKLAHRYVEEVRPYNLVSLVEEFRHIILEELNFLHEAGNMNRFRRYFKDDERVCIPKAFAHLATRRILVIEEIEGTPISDREAIDSGSHDKSALAHTIAEAFLKQVFLHGFFHADPHPGNVIAKPENRVAFIDFGMVGRIHRDTKDQLANMLVGYVDRNPQRIVNACISIGVVSRSADIHHFEIDIEDFVEQYYVSSLEEIKVGQLLMDLLDIVSSNRIQLPASLFLLGKAMVIIEGLCERLDPDFNMVVLIQPFAERLIRERYSPRRIAREVREFAHVFYEFTKKLPSDLSLIFDKVKEGKLHVEFEHKGLGGLIAELDKVSNRLAFALIIAALIIGSSIIMATDKGPLLLGFPVLGIIGYVIAAIMGLWLVIAIVRSGRLR